MNQIEEITKRNARVETNKAWETSWTRRVIIAAGTYLIIGGYLSFLHVEGAWLHALVPVMAYMLSTLSLPLIQALWIEKIYLRNKQG
ncbi:MAG TPA: hypothetical protein PK513_06545 [Alphaproteobacteria bacterium]|nr:MAG: hypothetical protein H6859_07680 [Rhodospirillales bacterium]HOO82142.1 hypothetical protein [Alphaproteobacteria bacterium]